MKTKALALLLLSSAAFAGLVTTDGTTSYELHSMPDNKMAPGSWPTSEADCIAKARASIGKWACVTRKNLETVADCADVAAPPVPLVKNAEGFWVEPEGFAQLVAGSDTVWTTVQTLYAHNPAWPSGAPNCWVPGLAPHDEWRVNGSNPNAVFMERKFPGQAEVPDLPNDNEPVCWMDECTAVPT